MIFEALHRLGAKPDLLMLYPAEYPLEDASEESRLLRKARDQYGVKLVPINIQRRTGDDGRFQFVGHILYFETDIYLVTWAESFTKLLVFNQTQYDRVLSLDSDATVLKLMDELFLLPPSTVALPRAYWLNKEFEAPKLSSMIALVQPSTTEFERIVYAMQTAGPREYDMEIFNKLYGDTAQIIPHRRYALLTRAFREDHRIAYLGNDYEEWIPKNVFDEAKYLHFSDWPVPKPWVPDHQKMEELKPKCVATDCTAQDVWVGFYSDFASKRLVFEPGPRSGAKLTMSSKFVALV
jgi:alpha-N-acetylglucosamine transferase